MSEWRQDVQQLLTPRGMLRLSEFAAAAIRDPRFREAVVAHGVVGCNILRPDHTGHLHLAQLAVHPKLLSRRDNQVAVRQYLRHDAGKPQRHRLTALDLT